SARAHRLRRRRIARFADADSRRCVQSERDSQRGFGDGRHGEAAGAKSGRGTNDPERGLVEGGNGGVPRRETGPRLARSEACLRVLRAAAADGYGTGFHRTGRVEIALGAASRGKALSHVPVRARDAREDDRGAVGDDVQSATPGPVTARVEWGSR